MNIDGKQREGDDFDKKVSSLYVRIQTSDVKDWRRLYNRIKHAQKNSEDINEYYSGQESLPEKLHAIRECVKHILLSKLR